MIWLWISVFLFTLLNIQTAFGDRGSQNPFFILPKDNPISKRYINMFDRDIEKALQSFDPQTGLIKVNLPENAVVSDPVIESLSIPKKKKIADKQEYIWSYQQSRRSAQLAAALAYAYSIKQSRYYQSPEILVFIKNIFQSYSEHQAKSGEFVFSPIHYSTVWGSHEMAWRLEPLICAFENIKYDLSASEKKSFREMLNRALEFLYTHPNSSLSNRGVVWCGVMAMCYRFTGNDKYLHAARQTFQWVGRLFNTNGEVREGPGPDLNYSTVSLQYLFLYRLMSGDSSLDSVMVRSLQWYTRMFTSYAVPLEGMTTRMWVSNGKVVSGILGALTFYSNQDVSFGRIATHYLEALEKLPGGFTLSHSSHHFLRGAQYHLIIQGINDIPYQPYAQLCQSDHSLYFLYGAKYQTAVTLRGRKSLKGLQTWSYKGQPPLIFPTRQSQSYTRGYGFDSHIMDAPWNVLPYSYRMNRIKEGLIALVYTTGPLCTAYLFANDLTLVIYHSKVIGLSTEWVSYILMAAEFDHIAGQQILFKNSDAKIIFNGADPLVNYENNTIIYQFESEGNTCWFAFAGPEASPQVEPLDHELFLITIKHLEIITKIIINLSAESITSNEISLSLPDNKPLLPYEAILVE